MKLMKLMAVLAAAGLITTGMNAFYGANRDIETGPLAERLNAARKIGRESTGLLGTEQKTAAQSRAISSGPLAARLSAAKHLGEQFNKQNQFKELTIAQVIAQVPELKALHDQLKANGLLAELENPNARLTLIAPTNNAVQAISLSQLPGNIKTIWQHHILKGDKSLQSLTSPAVINYTTANKQLLGGDLVDKVQAADIITKNGTIHIVSQVILPRESQAAQALIKKNIGYYPQRPGSIGR